MAKRRHRNKTRRKRKTKPKLSDSERKVKLNSQLARERYLNAMKQSSLDNNTIYRLRGLPSNEGQNNVYVKPSQVARKKSKKKQIAIPDVYTMSQFIPRQPHYFNPNVLFNQAYEKTFNNTDVKKLKDSEDIAVIKKSVEKLGDRFTGYMDRRYDDRSRLRRRRARAPSPAPRRRRRDTSSSSESSSGGGSGSSSSESSSSRGSGGGGGGESLSGTPIDEGDGGARAEAPATSDRPEGTSAASGGLEPRSLADTGEGDGGGATEAIPPSARTRQTARRSSVGGAERVSHTGVNASNELSATLNGDRGIGVGMSASGATQLTDQELEDLLRTVEGGTLQGGSSPTQDDVSDVGESEDESASESKPLTASTSQRFSMIGELRQRKQDAEKAAREAKQTAKAVEQQAKSGKSKGKGQSKIPRKGSRSSTRNKSATNA